MKKIIILAVAALAAFAACTKTEIAPEAQREINFAVANNVRARADVFSGAIYNNGPFGTCAWFNGVDDFMVNEQVDQIGGVWKTKDHTFYWPKTGSIDFISYSPFNGASDTPGTVPVVTKDSIKYNNLTVGGIDVMYADKVTCSSNVDNVRDSLGTGVDSGFSGVPTIFRHALAKLSFKVMANFIEWPDPQSPGDTTKWEITLNSFSIGGFLNTGSCALGWDSTNKTWNKPATDIGTATAPHVVYVWNVTDSTSRTAAQELVSAPVVLDTVAQDLAAANGFVLPQILTAGTGAQTITINAHIKTKLSNGKYINEDFVKTIDIRDISNLKAWEMNQNIVYTIKFKPTSKVDLDDSPEDVTITFDPAVADWMNVNTSATIQL